MPARPEPRSNKEPGSGTTGGREPTHKDCCPDTPGEHTPFAESAQNRLPMWTAAKSSPPDSVKLKFAGSRLKPALLNVTVIGSNPAFPVPGISKSNWPEYPFAIIPFVEASTFVTAPVTLQPESF